MPRMSSIMRESRWRRVIFATDCDEDGNCPVCGIDYAECKCPGPTMEDYEYRERNGVLYARPMVTHAEASRSSRS
jgi:hypothetical protein